jgi:C-terminal processing protease CtpA/Prc
MSRVHFLSLAGVLSIVIASPAASAPGEEAVSRDVQEQVITASIARLRAAYVFPEKVRALETALRRSLVKGRYTNLGGEAFAAAVTQDLRTAVPDKHLGLSFSRAPVPIESSSAGSAEDASRQRRIARRNFGFAAATILPGNVGLLKITNFAAPEIGAETLAAAMRFLGNTDGLVLDLTANGGGNGDMVALLLSYFVPPRTHLNSFFDRRNGTTRQVWSAPFVPGGGYGAGKPIAVAVDADTISAGEEVPYDLQGLKRAVIVGERTAGGANPGKDERVGEHFELFVPSGRAINPITGTNWEGTGVTPDVAASGAQAVTRAHLHVLEIIAKQGQDDRTRSDAESQAAKIRATLAPSG